MNNNKDLQSYIEEIISREKVFYIVDLEFWNDWCHYTNWGTNTNDEKEKIVEDKNITIKEMKPKINTTKISDMNGRLFQGLIYFNDYVILTEKMYELFSNWYIGLGSELKRFKIELPQEIIRKKSNFSKLTSLSTEVKKSEIEVYPIFVKFFMFEDLIKNNMESLENIKEKLSQLQKLITDDSNNNSYRLYPFSRMTKFKEIFKNIEMLYKLENLNIKSRLWIFYLNKFYLIPLEQTLEDENINDFTICVLEVMKDKIWPSENLEKEILISGRTKTLLDTRIFVGLTNIGNTCYMNSVMQLFLNNLELKEILLTEYFENCINYRNKNGAKGNLMLEFINILKEKWIDTKNNKITPRQWKELIGNFNEQFKGFDQQDAHDYFNFMLDILHEEVNLKTEKEYIENPEYSDGTEQELADEYWANNLRRNSSFVHSLFLGQLKSTLICQNCNSKKINYETFSSISVPIPQNSKIILEVVLFRLPFTFKVYYENFDQFFANINANFQNFDVRAQLKLIRKQSLDYTIDFNNVDQSIMSEKSLIQDSNIQNKIIGKTLVENTYEVFNTHFSESNNNIMKIPKENEYLYTSTLITNIPIKIKIEVDRKDKVEKIINKIIKINDLELEQDMKFTSLFIYNQGIFVDRNLKIDDCFQNNQTIFIYESLNSQGINKLFKYEREIENISNSEILIRIIHRYPTTKEIFLFNNFYYKKLDSFANFIILNTKLPIKIRDLYDLIWDKFEYFLNNPAKISKFLWWKPKTYKNKVDCGSEMSQSVKFCTPFVIKILNNESMSCANCPWFRFCSGCIIDPLKKEYLEIDQNNILAIEWCSEVVNKDINESNLKLILNHSSVKLFDDRDNKKINESKIKIEDCLNLFTEKEDLGEDDQLFCKKCRQQTSWYKKFDIERLPPYLVIVVKRFKFTRMYKKKIEIMIEYPLENLDLSNYFCFKERKNNSQFNLFGLVNHSGSLNGGHYTSIIRHDNKWIKYDDSNAYEVEENLIKTPYAYILVYKTNNHKMIDNSDYINMMKEVLFNESDLKNVSDVNQIKSVVIRESSISKGMINIEINNLNTPPDDDGNISSFTTLKNSLFTKYFKGEPVKTIYGRGFVIGCYNYEGVSFVRVKLKNGYASIRNNKNIIKETIFTYNKPTKEEEEKEKEEEKRKLFEKVNNLINNLY